MILTQPPPTFLLDVTLFTVFFGTCPLVCLVLDILKFTSLNDTQFSLNFSLETNLLDIFWGLIIGLETKMFLISVLLRLRKL